MALKEIIIKVDNQSIHLSPDLAVPIKHTNIPSEDCMFRSHADIFWKVELLDYSPDTKCLKIKVVDYSANDITNYDGHESIKEVKQISFERLDWPKLKPLLSSYKKSKMLDILQNPDADIFNREGATEKTLPNFAVAGSPNQSFEERLYSVGDTTTSYFQSEQNHTVTTHKVEFTVYFSDAHFMLGYVTFNKFVKEVGYKVDFKVLNDNILAEFENIKSWFSKRLQTKKFKVNATITSKEGKVIDTTASSPEIELINAELIDSIKYQRTLRLTKPPKISNIDKSIFTAEEIFVEMSTIDIEGNVFKQNEQDILNLLFNHRKPRNRKHLEYLSGNKQAENIKLRFTLHPNFGFLFFIAGEKNNHFVWELLNSHATYIWSIDKSEKEIEIQYKKIEAIINTIRDSGREQYKRAYRQQNHDTDLVFCVVEHDDITSNFVDGFVKWKYQLNEKIT